MEIVRPPLHLDPELIEYLDRQFSIVDNAINSTNGVVVIKDFPMRPREGRIYSIDGLFYYHDSTEWFKLTAEPFTPSSFINTSVLS